MWEGRPLFRIRTNPTSYIGRQLYYEGAENYEYSKAFSGIITRSRCFFDIGANLGYYSLLARSLNPKIRCAAFEPSPGVLEYLMDNIRINGMDRSVKAFRLALGDSVGTTRFHEVRNPKFPDMANLSGEHHIGTKNLARTRRFEVQMATLDSFCREHPEFEPDFIKIDTEGAEALILKGGRRTLEEARPLVVAETLFNRLEGELEDFMGGLGYRFFNACPEGLREVGQIRRTADDGVRNCFFVPEGKEDWIPLVR